MSRFKSPGLAGFTAASVKTWRRRWIQVELVATLERSDACHKLTERLCFTNSSKNTRVISSGQDSPNPQDTSAHAARLCLFLMTAALHPVKFPAGNITCAPPTFFLCMRFRHSPGQSPAGTARKSPPHAARVGCGTARSIAWSSAGRGARSPGRGSSRRCPPGTPGPSWGPPGSHRTAAASCGGSTRGTPTHELAAGGLRRLETQESKVSGFEVLGCVLVSVCGAVELLELLALEWGQEVLHSTNSTSTPARALAAGVGRSVFEDSIICNSGSFGTF